MEQKKFMDISRIKEETELTVANTNGFEVGDEVVMYYDGMAMETDPLQVSKVYAITLKTPADRSINDKQ